MPTVQADRLTKIGAALLRAAGASQEEADAVAVGCVNANLAGHDSHGIIAVPTYIDRIKAGHIVPGRPVDDRAGIAGHDRHRRPLGLRLPRQRQGDAADHRQGEEDQRRRLHGVPPEPCRPAGGLSADGDQGGHDRPCHRGLGPLAQGRGALRRPRGTARHQSDLDRGAVRPRGAVLSRHGDLGGGGRQGDAGRRARRADPDRLGRRRDGKQTTDPTRLRKGGALLPLGGTEGYKGSGLAAMVEILCGLLTGLGFGVEPTRPAQRRLLHGRVQRRRLPAARRVQDRRWPSSPAI